MKTSLKPLLVLLATAAACQLAGAATTYLWNVASPGANNWNANPNWLPNTGNPGVGDTAIFGAVGTGSDAFTINNVASVNTTIAGLTFTNTTTGNWHVTRIPTGVTLTVNSLTVGFSTAVNGLVTSAAMTDAGTLQVNSSLTVGNNGSTSADTGTILDLSGLTNFVFNASAGTFALSTGNRSAADMKFAAASNYITAGTMNLNTASSSSLASGTVTLGAGTNIINTGTCNIGLNRNRCTVQFSGASGGLRLRGVGGTDADLATMTVGNRNNSGGSGGTTSGTLSLNGHPVDMRLGTLTLGRQSNATGGGTDVGTGVLSFDNGTVFAQTILMALTSTTNSAQANGTINVGATGLLTVGTGGLSLANQTAGTASGALNINGGTVFSTNSITKANTSGLGALTNNAGTLDMVAGTIGTPAIPVDTLSTGDAVLGLTPIANGTNVVVTTLVLSSTTNNTINILALPAILSFPAQFALIRYASGSSDFLLGAMPAGYSGFLSNNAGIVDLVVTNGPITVRPLVWNGTPSGDWNTSTTDWLYLGGPTAYNQNDVVTFDDTAAGTTTVNLTTTLTPGGLTVSNATKSYTFNGTGNIGGNITFVKDGAAQLTVANSGVNTFSNGVSILAGKLQLSGSADRLPTGSIVTLADVSGAVLDLNSVNQTIRSLNGGGLNGGNVSLGSAILTDWTGGTYGGVISGSGRLVKTNWPNTTGGTLVLTNANLYTGGTLIGGYTNNTTLAVANPTGSGTGSGFVRVLTNGSLFIGNNGPAGAVAAGVITNDGTVRLFRADDVTFTNVFVGQGLLQIQCSNSVVLNAVNAHTGGTTITLGTVCINNPGALGSGTVIVGNGAPAALQLSNNITVANPLTLQSKPTASGVAAHIENLSGTNTLSGPISLTQNGTSGWLFYATDGHLLVSGNVIPVPPSQTSQNVTRILWLRGDASAEWRGNIVDSVNSVTNLALRKDGLGTWILSGADTYTGPTVVSNGTLLVNGTLAATGGVSVEGGTLGGTGLIGGPVTVDALGTLAPGSSPGTLTISNSLTLNGTTVMEVSDAAADQVAGVSSLTLGGTLQVLVTGSLSGWEVFRLFSATNYSGDFATYDLPALPSPLTWDASSVPVDGTLKVIGGLPHPIIGPVRVSGTNLVVSVPTIAGTNYVLQSATNLAPPIAWRNESTNSGTGSALILNVPIDPAKPRKFVRFWVD